MCVNIYNNKSSVLCLLYSAHVLTEDTIEREMKNGKLHSKRLLSKTNPVPKWGEHFYRNSKSVKIVEESIVDPKERTLTTYTRNIAFTKVMVSKLINNSNSNLNRISFTRIKIVRQYIFICIN